MTGAIAAYLHLAYDLYALDHNAELQKVLITRLRNHDKFSGARYETFVAAAFVRAGFDLAFENEDDRRTTHCEFTATDCKTGRRFSVEAKRREGRRIRIGGLFNDALSKHAEHQRVVCIEMNVRDDTNEAVPAYLRKALRRVRSFEGQPLNGKVRPPAYVFVTNCPWDLYLDEVSPRFVAVAEGFQIPDFKYDRVSTLREALDARDKHIEMHNLLASLRDHSDIPSTFGGELPAYAFNPTAQRILIGERYLFQDSDGKEQPGLVTAATVIEHQRMVLCGVTFDDAKSVLYSAPISDEELEDWRKHPDTFFGVVGQRKTEVNTLLEFYDFWLESFKKLSRERLLELLANAPDVEDLRKLDQRQLASIYAERMAEAAFQKTQGDRIRGG